MIISTSHNMVVVAFMVLLYGCSWACWLADLWWLLSWWVSWLAGWRTAPVIERAPGEGAGSEASPPGGGEGERLQYYTTKAIARQ